MKSCFLLFLVLQTPLAALYLIQPEGRLFSQKEEHKNSYDWSSGMACLTRVLNGWITPTNESLATNKPRP